MEARNRALPEWLSRVASGQIRLPRFQRYEAWGHDRVTSLLQTVLRGLPAGATLVLDVGDKEPFVSRAIVGAPNPTERVTEHLLDGQQRLTALWRSFSDNYEDRTYFIKFDVEDNGDSEVSVISQPRWVRNGKRYPVWADSALEIHSRGYIPLRLLRPGDLAQDIRAWCRDAVGIDSESILNLNDRIVTLRERVTTFNLPFLSLPIGTPKFTAIDVFVEMNRSAVQLSAFDIIVAQVEEATGESLHSLVSSLRTRVPLIDFYGSAPELVLSIAALREDLPPTQASFQRLDLDRLVKEWDEIIGGIAFALNFLDEEKIFDSERLPTIGVVYTLAAVHDCVPKVLDASGNAKTLLRKYLWRAFATSRYENNAAARSLQDARGLRAMLAEGKPESQVPIFDEVEFPLPTLDELKRAGWPKKKDTLARCILAVSLRGGGQDLADETPASRAHLKSREYHHLFPDSLLQNVGGITGEQPYKALNCALITWNTNRNISAKEPIQYLRERVLNAVLGENQIRSRLRTHAIPFDALNVGGYANIADAVERAGKVSSDYDAFLTARGQMVLAALKELCEGKNWSGMDNGAVS
jgi:hypothetical protein